MNKKMIKYFDENGMVKFCDGNSFNNEFKIIREIPKKHSHFNNGNEYVDVNEENLPYLSKEDMIIAYTSTGTIWEELKAHEDTLLYKFGAALYFPSELLNHPSIDKIIVRNDFYVPNYARGNDHILGSTLQEQIKELSSGTMGSLTNIQDYKTLDIIQETFLKYSSNLPSTLRWQSAWEIFKGSKEYIELL